MSEEQEKGKIERFTDWVLRRKPQAIQQAKRFYDIGLLKYPEREQLDFRIFNYDQTIAKIDSMYAEVYAKRTRMLIDEERKKLEGKPALSKSQIDDIISEELRSIQQLSIKKLESVFSETGSPYFRGIDSPRLTKKALQYRKILACFGDNPSVYPILNYGTNVLLDVSWRDKDVSPEPKVLMETKMQTIQGSHQFSVPSEFEAIDADTRRKKE